MTDGRMYEQYADWVVGHAADVEIIRLGYALDNFGEVEKCQGLVFTGGEDVHPSYYGKLEYLSYCSPPDFDERRDEFEFQLLRYTLNRPMPLLGVCRGLQLINVFHGGTLIPDIPSWGKFDHATKLPDGKERDHTIYVDNHSQLYGIIGQSEGTVNSLHHQSAGKIGKGLAASAMSIDGVVEALEWKELQKHAFMCLVQWHPERMEDHEAPFVKNIRETFIKEVKEFNHKTHEGH